MTPSYPRTRIACRRLRGREPHARSLRFAWGSGTREGTFFPCLDVGSHSYWPYRLRSKGTLEFQFYWMLRRPPLEDEDVRHQFRERLYAIDSVNFGPAVISKQPSFKVALIRDQEQRRRFDAAIEWFFEIARNETEDSIA